MPCIRDPAVQQAIADAYIENGGNKEQAVIAAGYSERYARGNASKLVAISGVQEKINARKGNRTMKTYDVTITETLQMTIPIRANSREEAEQMVEEAWKHEKYVLDSSHFQEVNFHAKGQIKERENER